MLTMNSLESTVVFWAALPVAIISTSLIRRETNYIPLGIKNLFRDEFLHLTSALCPKSGGYYFVIFHAFHNKN
jgi:hypothetical protein